MRIQINSAITDMRSTPPQSIVSEESAVFAECVFLIVVLVLAGIERDTLVVSTVATILPSSMLPRLLFSISSSPLLPSGRGSCVLVIV